VSQSFPAGEVVYRVVYQKVVYQKVVYQKVTRDIATVSAKSRHSSRYFKQHTV
jgi:hypothetical protein